MSPLLRQRPMQLKLEARIRKAGLRWSSSLYLLVLASQLCSLDWLFLVTLGEDEEREGLYYSL